ncbi:hypothetical protein CQW23_34610 [Capsicum baccatum]|uniref:SWIM-type domain-containing protein n=1 Tax=Capsicum baccatum TaxID=33114 RepID=A0A2G2UYR2_CAPBA|nr:hypothetical protein CQW23_34610 [Capsicum baccatum]
MSSAAACLEHEVGFEKWSWAHFSSNRFNVMPSNITKSLNSVLGDERKYPVAEIFNSIAHRFGEIFRKRYAEMDNSNTTFIPVAEMILRENMTEGDKLYITNINGRTHEFTILGYGRSAKVNLSRRSCSCGKYDLVKFSCAHAMEALHLKNGNEYGTRIYNYSSQIYLKESYLLAYLEPICSAPLEWEWSDNGGCSYFKWISSYSEASKFQGIAKFEMFERFRDFEENRDLLMTLYRESKHKIDHLKGLLKDVEIEMDQPKHKLVVSEEKEKGMKFMVYDLLLVLTFLKGVMGV